MIIHILSLIIRLSPLFSGQYHCLGLLDGGTTSISDSSVV